jgi:Protein of unknown function (DUF1573)
MHFILLLASSFLLFSLSRGLGRRLARSAQPELAIIPTQVDLGVVPVAQPFKRTFLLRNVGGARLLVTDVKSTCQCTVADLPTRAVEPGASVLLHVTFKASSAGRKSQSVKIQSNDLSEPNQVIKITANAVATSQP